MIISASRRTDIPAFYMDWFLHRLQEKFVYVRNPLNFHQVSRVLLTPEVIDCIVFWSKNPKPMLGKLSQMEAYPYYIQFTITGYDRKLEPNLPSLPQRINTFQALAEQLGSTRVIWRYDPIFLSPTYTLEYHLEQFHRLAEQLKGCTERCVFSFGNDYASLAKQTAAHQLQVCNDYQKHLLASKMAELAKANQLALESCAEEMELGELGIGHSHCIDERLISRLIGAPLQVKKDGSQRSACGCVESVDIGAYQTCIHNCSYCYANQGQPGKLWSDLTSSMLGSQLENNDLVKERRMKRLKENQLKLF